MPRFTILPSDETFFTAEVFASSACGLLDIVARLEWQEGDVLRDDAYCFSFRLGDRGFWYIFQREDNAQTEPVFSAFG